VQNLHSLSKNQVKTEEKTAKGLAQRLQYFGCRSFIHNAQHPGFSVLSDCRDRKLTAPKAQ
jgi:hypothetical protein